ncbi:hypothetical protein BaRGS_00039644 [Batillaria attramentaria]|uniref:Dermatopontin n=1 Tax=Batillaria attramentaria TaxID=370345 RepID=A0ABD0J285_9CAEN
MKDGFPGLSSFLSISVGLLLDWVNDFDGIMDFTCPGNGVITGWQGYHNNHREDRRFKFRCCDMDVGLRDCSWSGDANGWDGELGFQTSGNRVLHGVYSRHNNRREDRLFRFNQCRRG